MSTLKKNIIANYIGKAWAAIINIAFVPLYIKYMGIEAYGLVGIFAAIQPLMTILDLGLSPSINRELARYSASPGNESQMRNLVRTLELIYWAIAVFLCLCAFLLSPLVATRWVHSETLPLATINQAVLLMGLSIVFQWPVGFYTGGLMGLQRQVLFNVINTIIWTLRGVGALLVVMVAANPVVGFFGWQLLMSIINVAAVAVTLWRSLPQSAIAARFSPDIMKSVWRLAIGMSAVSILVLIFNQLDKLILSKLISLTDFGYYSLAWQVVGSLFMLYYPIYSAFFPVMTQCVAQGDLDSFCEAYHKGCQLMSAVLLPASVVLACYSKDILLLWVRNPTTAENCSLLLSLLIIGASFNGMLCMQYAVSQAFGQTRYMLIVYVFAVIAYIPVMLVVAMKHGVVGAAVTFSLFSILQDYLLVRITHKRFIPKEHCRWLVRDVGKPLLVSLGVVLLTKYLIAWPIAGLTGTVTVLIVYAVTLVAASMVTPAAASLIRNCVRV